MRTLLILTLALFSSQIIANEEKLKNLPKLLKEQVLEQVEAQLGMMQDSEIENNQNEIWSLARINLQTFAFVELNVLFFEMKIQPFVELRWDKKLPNGYRDYHSK